MSLVEILETLSFQLHNVLWLDIAVRVKTVKLNNVSILVSLSILRTGPQSVGKYNRIVNILLEAINSEPLDKAYLDCAWSQGLTFPFLRCQKKLWRHLLTS